MFGFVLSSEGKSKIIFAYSIFSPFVTRQIFQKNIRNFGEGRGQFDAGLNGLILMTSRHLKEHLQTTLDRISYCLELLFGVLYSTSSAIPP